MKESIKQYILKNLDKKSVKQIADDLGLKERKVRKFIELNNLPSKKIETSNIFSMPRKKLWMSVSVIVVLGLIVYSNSFHTDFHYDDQYMIIDNPAIRNLWDTNTIFNSFNTRFIPGLTFALNYAVGKLNPSGYHAMNIFIHILSSICVFFLVYLTAQTPRMATFKLKEKAASIAFISSLFFLLHPAQSQAVNYIWQRVALLASFFYLAAVTFYSYFRLSKKWLFYLMSILSVLLGMFSKEIVFTIPFMIIIYEFLFFSNWRFEIQKRILILIPFLFTLLVIPFTLMRYEQITTSIMRPEIIQRDLKREDHVPTQGFDITRWVGEEAMTRKEYLLTQFNVFRTYVRLFFWPVNQNLDYDYPIAKRLDKNTIISVIFFFTLLFSSALFLKQQPAVSFAILWIYLTMSVESLVVQRDVIYEHRLYLPMFGFIIFFVPILYLSIKSKRNTIVIFTIISIILSSATWRRNMVWKNELTLWADVVKKSPEKARGHFNLALEFDAISNEDEAFNHYLKAIECDRKYAENKGGMFVPDANRGYVNLARIYFTRGDFANAIYYTEEAIRISPSHDKNIAKMYMNIAMCYEKLGELNKAREYYGKALAVDPTMSEPDHL